MDLHFLRSSQIVADPFLKERGRSFPVLLFRPRLRALQDHDALQPFPFLRKHIENILRMRFHLCQALEIQCPSVFFFLISIDLQIERQSAHRQEHDVVMSRLLFPIHIITLIFCLLLLF